MANFIWFVILAVLTQATLWYNMPLLAVIAGGGMLFIGYRLWNALPQGTVHRVMNVIAGLALALAGFGFFARFAGRSLVAEWNASRGLFGIASGNASLAFLTLLGSLALVLYYFANGGTVRDAWEALGRGYNGLYARRKTLAVPLVTLFVLVVAIGAFRVNAIAMWNVLMSQGPAVFANGQMPPDMMKLIFITILAWIVASRYMFLGGPGLYGRNFVMPFILVGGLSMLLFNEQAAWLLEFEKSIGMELLGYLWLQKLLGAAAVILFVAWIISVERIPAAARPVLSALDAQNIIVQAAMGYGRTEEESRLIAANHVPLRTTPPIPGAPAPEAPVAAAAPVAPAPRRIVRTEVRTGHGLIPTLVWAAVALALILVVGAWLFYGPAKVVVAASPAAVESPQEAVTKRVIVLKGIGRQYRTGIINLGALCSGFDGGAGWTRNADVRVFTTDNPNTGFPACADFSTTDNRVAFEGPAGTEVHIKCYRTPRPSAAAALPCS